MMKWTIPFPPHFSWKECIWYLDRGYDDVLHSIDNGSTLYKCQVIGGQTLLFSIKEENESLALEILNASPTGSNGRSGTAESAKSLGPALVDWVKEWLDMDRDLNPFYKLLKKTKQIPQADKNYNGLRVIGIPDLYEAICWCIIGQQINLSFAHSVKRQFVHTYGKSIRHKGRDYYLFPEPARVAELKPEDFYALQFSRQKADYILHISRLFVSGDLSKAQLDAIGGQTVTGGAGSTADKLKALLAIRGIGPWTANYVGMKTLRCMDCIPYGDAGIHQAMVALGHPPKPSKVDVDAFFAPFKGWESYLVFYLWRSLYGSAPGL